MVFVHDSPAPDLVVHAPDLATGLYDPRFVTMLVRNYRSHPAIIQLPSAMFYHGRAVQVDPRLTPGWTQLARAWFQSLNVKYDVPVSNFAFNSNLRPSTTVAWSRTPTSRRCARCADGTGWRRQTVTSRCCFTASSVKTCGRATPPLGSIPKKLWQGDV